MIDLNNSTFIVDGISDQKSIKAHLQKNFQASPRFLQARCNGKDVTPDGYVNAIHALLHAELSSNTNHIICILDKEQRKETIEKLTEKIIASIEIKLSRHPPDKIKNSILVFVADTMIENWIVADIEGIKAKKTLIKEDAEQKMFDGKNGSTILKRIMKIPYGKTEHAEILMKAINIDRAINNSPSYAVFYNRVLKK